MNPSGHHTGDSASGHFAVKENTDVQENYKTWVWDGSAWQPVMDEDVTNTWNGGLVFYLAEALSGGSVDEVTNAQGSVTWTLVLAVKP